jgi:hypothetical protein
MAPNPALIYHITNIENLVSIIKNEGLIAYSQIKQNGLNYVNIAHQTIQDRRATTRVSLPPHGVLHDYVPFYFAPRSPMLYTINRGNVIGYSGGQSSVIYLISTVQNVRQQKIPFVFTDGHGIIGYTRFFNREADLDQVDWEIMESRYWNDTNDDMDRKRRRQAEFLAFRYFPLSCVQQISVYNRQIKQRVLSELGDIAIPVNIQAGWYY